MCLLDALPSVDIEPEGAKVAIAGSGNVGSWAARIAHEHGMQVVAISNSRCAIRNDDGIDGVALFELLREGRELDEFDGAEGIDPGELLTTPCDALVPAALGGMIHAENADLLDCRVVVEGANSPTTPRAEKALAERDVLVVPDVLANAGGVVVSYFEWAQNLQHFRWSEDEVKQRLADTMRGSYREVAERAERDGGGLREAAYCLGIERVVEAARTRGSSGAALSAGAPLARRSHGVLALRGKRLMGAGCSPTDGAHWVGRTDAPGSEACLGANGRLSGSEVDDAFGEDHDVPGDGHPIAGDRRVQTARPTHLDALVDADALDSRALVQVGDQRAGRRSRGRILDGHVTDVEHEGASASRARRGIRGERIDRQRVVFVDQRGHGRAVGPAARKRIRTGHRRDDLPRPRGDDLHREVGCGVGRIQADRLEYALRWELRAEHRRLLEHRRAPPAAVELDIDRLEAGVGLLDVAHLAFATRAGHRHGGAQRRVTRERHLAGRHPDAVPVVGVGGVG